MSLNIYFFGGVHTVGYCPECNKQAVYSEAEGFHCPECKTQNLDIFELVESAE